MENEDNKDEGTMPDEQIKGTPWLPQRRGEPVVRRSLPAKRPRESQQKESQPFDVADLLNRLKQGEILLPDVFPALKKARCHIESFRDELLEAFEKLSKESGSARKGELFWRDVCDAYVDTYGAHNWIQMVGGSFFHNAYLKAEAWKRRAETEVLRSALAHDEQGPTSADNKDQLNEPEEPEAETKLTAARQTLALCFILEELEIDYERHGAIGAVTDLVALLKGTRKNAKNISIVVGERRAMNSGRERRALGAGRKRDLQFILPYFERMGLRGIAKKINEEMQM